MRSPERLGAVGRGAFRRAVRALEAQDDADRLYELAARYAHAVDLADRARREWRRAGSPLTITHPNGITSAHPLIGVLKDAERDAGRYGDAVGLKPVRVTRRGPDPVAKITADIGESPAARLRRVS